MKWFSFIKKEKKLTPNKLFEDSLPNVVTNSNISKGVSSLLNGNTVKILDDGTGYELALEIKRGVVLEYQLRMAKKIQINGDGDEITISFK